MKRSKMSHYKWPVYISLLCVFSLSGCYIHKGKLYLRKSDIPRPQSQQQKQPQVTQKDPVKQPSNQGQGKEPKPPVKVKPADPFAGYATYEPLTKLKGSFNSLGSDTMEKIMELCAEGFMKHHPALRFRVESQGSGDAVNALASKKAQIGPMSRPLKDKEAALLASTFSYPATQIPVALDALAVYVNPNNPLLEKGLTLAEIDAIFSSTRAKGYPNDITSWGQLKLEGEWASKPIEVYSRNSISGTYGFFLKTALSTKTAKGKYKASNHEMYDSTKVVNSVAKDKFAIGYSGIGYNNPSVETLPLSVKEGDQAYAPTPKNVYSEKYPLWRYLYITVMINPDERISENHAEFLRYIFSKEGQKLIQEAGYFPIEATMAANQLKKLRLR